MPPKPKFTKEEIISAALDIVSSKGVEALTARELGQALGSSARPIFTIFRSMEELMQQVRQAAMNRFEACARSPLPGMPLFKQVGMQMVLFGVREPKLYQLLFMQENRSAASFDDVFGILGTTADMCIATIRQDYGMEEAKARKLFENMWIYTFGVGALCATKMCSFPAEKLGQLLSAEFQAMMMLLGAEEPPKNLPLETQRLTLREMTAGDYDALYAVLGDSDIMQHYPYTFTEARVQQWIAVNQRRYREHGFGLWAVCLKETGEMIGDCGLTLQNINGRQRAEIGYHIARAHQRQGYAKEAARACLGWTFTHTTFGVVYSYMRKENLPSIATAKANGMRLMEEYTDEDGQQMLVYGITRQDWQTMKE